MSGLTSEIEGSVGPAVPCPQVSSVHGLEAHWTAAPAGGAPGLQWTHHHRAGAMPEGTLAQAAGPNGASQAACR